jgi:hypothetical protein
MTDKELEVFPDWARCGEESLKNILIFFSNNTDSKIPEGMSYPCLTFN